MKQSATFDSSFWINAHRSGVLEYVLDDFELHFTPAVATELRPEFPSGREFWHLVETNQLQQRIPTLAIVSEFGRGERDAINLALEFPEWMLLIDDRRPLRRAEQLKITAMSTPFLVVRLYQHERCSIDTAIQILARLAAIQTVSPTLLELALASISVARRSKEE